MNRLFRHLSSSLSFAARPTLPPPPATARWARGIRVEVREDNLERAVAVLKRKMQRSGIERLIKRHAEQRGRHVKQSEKRVLARKSLQFRVRSQDLARRLQDILAKKVRGL